jgi:CheY-like chemotaxis protein
MILLDLGLPRLDGVEVIAELQKEPDFKDIPVVILAASPHDQNLLREYAVPS